MHRLEITVILLGFLVFGSHTVFAGQGSEIAMSEIATSGSCSNKELERLTSELFTKLKASVLKVISLSVVIQNELALVKTQQDVVIGLRRDCDEAGTIFTAVKVDIEREQRTVKECEDNLKTATDASIIEDLNFKLRQAETNIAVQKINRDHAETVQLEKKTLLDTAEKELKSRKLQVEELQKDVEATGI